MTFLFFFFFLAKNFSSFFNYSNNKEEFVFRAVIGYDESHRRVFWFHSGEFFHKKSLSGHSRGGKSRFLKFYFGHISCFFF